MTSLTYPSKMMLAAAMNPCPCGYHGDLSHECTCNPMQIQKYRSKISGPLLDRIDIHIEVPAVKFKELSDLNLAEKSEKIRLRVNEARSRQHTRFAGHKQLYCNAHMESRDIREFCPLDDKSQDLLRLAIGKLGLSARAYDRIIKVARTIADLECCDNIDVQHISEAIQYRSLDRSLWTN